MRSRATSASAVIVVLFCIPCLLPAPARAQAVPQRFIRSDAVWSGVVEIAADVTIIGAELRVQAGTTIRLASGQRGRGPVIRLNSPLFVAGERSRPARLVLDGTPDQPIIVESVDEISRGSIESAPGSTACVDARHVVFRRLGRPAPHQAAEPAIALQLVAPENDLWLTDCRFEDCGSVLAEFVGSDASAEIARCSFTGTRGPLAIRVAGPGKGVKVVDANVLDAGIELACPQALIRGNVLVGETASLVVRKSAEQGVAVVGNYVHCTTDKDVGRYVAKCEEPSTRLVENVLVGGSYVVETAPRVVQRNVVIGVGGLEADIAVTAKARDLPGITAMTHAFVSNVAPDSVLSSNLFLGPAYAAIAPSKAVNARIEGNFFDGWGSARRVLHFDVAATGTAQIGFSGNTIMGYTQVPMVAESKRGSIDLKAADNIFVGIEGSVYEGFADLKDLGAGDRRVETLNALSLPQPVGRGSPSTQAAADVDELLVSRRKSVADVHRMWFEIYGMPRN